MNEKMLLALNTQINKELYSAYLYLSMAAYFESQNLKGFSHWMRLQAAEEQVHAMKIFDYVCERGDNVKLLAIDEPPLKWKSPLDVFENAYVHEQKVTQMIHNLVNIAKDVEDHATQSFLTWFVDEQVEEEASASEIVDKIKFIGDHKSTLLFLDTELGKRGNE